MKKKTKIILTIPLLLLFAWAPWLDNQAVHDKVLRERGWKSGTIVTPEQYKEHHELGEEDLQVKEHYELTDEDLQKLLEESRKKGIENGILICDYKVMWFPFGRWVANCEGGYFVTFWGQILP